MTLDEKLKALSEPIIVGSFVQGQQDGYEVDSFEPSGEGYVPDMPSLDDTDTPVAGMPIELQQLAEEMAVAPEPSQDYDFESSTTSTAGVIPESIQDLMDVTQAGEYGLDFSELRPELEVTPDLETEGSATYVPDIDTPDPVQSISSSVSLDELEVRQPADEADLSQPQGQDPLEYRVDSQEEYRDELPPAGFDQPVTAHSMPQADMPDSPQGQVDSPDLSGGPGSTARPADVGAMPSHPYHAVAALSHMKDMAESLEPPPETDSGSGGMPPSFTNQPSNSEPGGGGLARVESETSSFYEGLVQTLERLADHAQQANTRLRQIEDILSRSLP